MCLLLSLQLKLGFIFLLIFQFTCCIGVLFKLVVWIFGICVFYKHVLIITQQHHGRHYVELRLPSKRALKCISFSDCNISTYIDMTDNRWRLYNFGSAFLQLNARNVAMYQNIIPKFLTYVVFFVLYDFLFYACCINVLYVFCIFRVVFFVLYKIFFI